MRYTMILLYGKAGQGALASGPVDAQRCSTCQIEAMNEAAARAMAERIADELLKNLIRCGSVTTYRTIAIPTPENAIQDGLPLGGIIEPFPAPPDRFTGEPSRYRDHGWDVVTLP